MVAQMVIRVLQCTYLKCADNNQAGTVLERFTEAVQIHGLPNCVCSNLGLKNVSVECLWQDVQRCVCSLFADTYHNMKDGGGGLMSLKMRLICSAYILCTFPE